MLGEPEERLWYQTEKTKRLRRLSAGRKPAAKVELGEMRIWFWVGVHGEFEEENEEIFFGCCWDEVNSGLKRKIRKKKKKKIEKEEGGDMVELRAAMAEEDEVEDDDGDAPIGAAFQDWICVDA